jgi:hypothetical protein
LLSGTSRSKPGFAGFDAMLSLVPLAMMLSWVMQVAELETSMSLERMESQQLLDKLVSIADYAVKSGAVVRRDGLRYPNWIDESLLTPSFSDGLRAQAGLGSLYVGPGEPGESYRMCIYRLAAYGEDLRPGRLFVCGS